MVSIRVILLIVVALISSCGFKGSSTKPDDNQKTETPKSPVATSELLPFGNPSAATSDLSDKNNFIVMHDSFILSYNNERGTLNWIAWRTTRADLGSRRDRPRFTTDENLPAGFKRIQYYDYSGSGYERGHMVPSADRFSDVRRNEETFNMTNIVPQTGDLNEHPWQDLESYARSLAYRGNETYTIAGVYGEKEKLRGKVSVPTNCWKVIVVFRRGVSRNRLDQTTRVIAVDMPNEYGIANASWQQYKTTVRNIEAKTGYDIFNLLPRDVQEAIETRLDNK